MNNKEEQKIIWLDLNPEKFESFSFSPDYKVILAKIDEHWQLFHIIATQEKS